MRHGLLLLLMSWVLTAFGSESQRGGYLVSLQVQGQDITLDRVTALPRFEPVTSLSGRAAWRVELVDPADTALWSGQVPSPDALTLGMPQGQPLLIAFRVPVPAGEALLRLRDADGKTRFSVYLDAAFAENARRERESFMQWLDATPKAAPSDEEDQARASGYIARQQTILQQRSLGIPLLPENCKGPGMRFIPELAGSGQPCVAVPDHAPGVEVAPDRDSGAKADTPTKAATQDAVAPPKAKVTLNGRILDSSGGVPGRTFHVQVEDGVAATVHNVDAQGRFTAQVESGRPLTILAFPFAPWIADVFTDPGITNTASREYRLERGIQLSGRVVMPGASIATNTHPMYVSYQRRGRNVYSYDWLAANGAYSFAIPPDEEVTVSAGSLPSPFLLEPLRLGPYVADTVRDIVPVRGVALRGRLTSDGGSALQAPYLHIFPNGSNYGRGLSIDASGRFAALIEAGRGYRLNTGADRHFAQSTSLSPQSADVEHNVVLEQGITLTGQVRERAGGPVVADAVVRVMDINGTGLPSSNSASSGFSSLLRRETRHIVEAGRNTEIWPAPVVVDSGNTDLTRNLYVPLRHAISVSLKAPDAQPLAYGRVEFWQDDKFLIAAHANAQGTASLTLPAGQYTVRIRPNAQGYRGNDYLNLHLYGHGIAPKTFTVSGPMSLELKLVASQIAKMTLESAWVAGDTRHFRGRWFELLSGSTVVATSRNPGNHATSAQGVRVVADLHVPNGRTYRVRMHTPGLPSWTSEAFTAREGGVVTIGLSPSSASVRWKGKTRNAAGQAVSAIPYVAYDQGQNAFDWGNSGADGGFDLPACDGCTYWFGAPADGNALGHYETLSTVTGSFTRDVTFTQVLDFEPQVSEDRRLQRLWGAPEGERHDILFIGDGFTSRNETFTDRNGNGVWDGVLYYDLNQNGVWDSSEPYATYGNAPSPTPGSDASVNNEPFNDLNGDGALNIGEAQIFFRNARDYLRAVLAFDYWREHRHLFRAWTYLAYSEQAGTSVDVPGSGRVVSRDTLLGAAVETGRWLLSVDYSRASQLAAEVLPSFDTVVVLINQPIPVGRANSFILANAGPIAGSPNTATPAHEFGHKVGELADEYDEFPDPLLGATPWGNHMSRSLDRRVVPWRDLLPGGFSTQQPTAPGATGIGLYEGGAYQSSGVYRSTFHSTMRYNSPRFSPHQRALMDQRIQPLLAGRGLLTIASVKQCDGTGLARARLRWDVRGTGVKRIQIRSGSLAGSAFASSSILNSAATTGKWARDGSRFFLLDADTGALLDIAEASVTTAGCPTRFVAFDPSPAMTCSSDLKAATRVYWNVTANTPEKLRLTLEDGGSTRHFFPASRRGSMEVLVGKGAKVRLRNHANGAEHASATLDVNALGCDKVTFTATPNPIRDCDGDGKGIARVAWDVTRLSNRSIDIRLRTIDGTRWYGGGPRGSRETGNWLLNNDKLFLIDRQSGTVLGEQTIRVVAGTPAACPAN
ncbi:M64 family metallo-endopeptidase [Xanthomonadaceae bacterium JHOS43]|nr:M64 family metallo-endopeptidase [Xanthomonadaceae bacterium JHOS43]